MKLKRAVLGCCTGCFALLLACTQMLTLSGPGSETTNGMVVAGVAQLPDGTPAAGAAIYVRNAASLPDTSQINNVAVPDTVAASDGSFSCSVPESAGEYIVEINYQSKYASAIHFNPVSTQNVGRVTLPQTAGFHGSLNLQGFAATDNIYVQIYGSHRIGKMGADGTFSFLGLPSGRHVVRMFSNRSSYGIMDKDTVELFPAENRDMGTYIMPFLAWLDTVVVRSILDSNGLDTVRTADVVTVNANKRVVILDLTGYGITTVPSSVALLRLRQLKLGQNNVTSIPSIIGFMPALNYLGLRANALATVPAALGILVHLSYLDLGKNDLSTLPVALTNLSQLQGLWVDNNHLTAVTDPVLTWINTYSTDPAWASSQQ